MITCSFPMIPNGCIYAMSIPHIGGNGRHPRDTNQRPSPGSSPVQSVRRKLFGDVDHHQTSLDLERELKQCEERDRSKFNFDFNSEQPINSSDSRYEWSQISTESNATEDTDFNVSTKLCKISDQNIAQSSTQSQSSPGSLPEPEPESHSTAVGSVEGLYASQQTTSATSAPDSQPESSSSAVEPTLKDEEKHKIVTKPKQKKMTEYFQIEGRKRRITQRKRSAAQVLSHENRGETKRQRFECTSAVKPEDIDTTTTTDVTDTDVRADEDSVRNTGTPV